MTTRISRRDFFKALGTSPDAVCLPDAPSPRELEEPLALSGGRYEYEVSLRPDHEVLATLVPVPAGIPCRLWIRRPAMGLASIYGIRTACRPFEVMMSMSCAGNWMTMEAIDATIYTMDQLRSHTRSCCRFHCDLEDDLCIDLDAFGPDDTQLPLLLAYQYDASLPDVLQGSVYRGAVVPAGREPWS